jgi:hypothetical protein
MGKFWNRAKGEAVGSNYCGHGNRSRGLINTTNSVSPPGEYMIHGQLSQFGWKINVDVLGHPDSS